MTAKVAATIAAARHVEPPAYRITALGERHRGHAERERAEAEAEPEDALPAGARDEHAADHRAEREREPRDGSPDTECERPFPPLRIDVADQRERARLRARCADSHHDPAGDEDARCGGERRHDRAGTEDRDAREHHLLPPEQVAERPAREHERGEREQVAVDDPLEAADADAERRLDVGERNADDRVVEEGDEEDRADGRESHPAGVTLPGERERAHAEDVTPCRRWEGRR